MAKCLEFAALSGTFLACEVEKEAIRRVKQPAKASGETEQNAEGLWRALHRRRVAGSQRLVLGPWRRGSTQASADLEKLERSDDVSNSAKTSGA